MSLEALMQVAESAQNAEAIALLLAFVVSLAAGCFFLVTGFSLLGLLSNRVLFALPDRAVSLVGVFLLGAATVGAFETAKPAFYRWLTSEHPVTIGTACLQATRQVLSTPDLTGRLDGVVAVCGRDRVLAAAHLDAERAPTESRRELARVALDALATAKPD